MELHTQAQTRVPLPREVVFDYATDVTRLPQAFRGAGPIPAIEKAHILGDGRMIQGAVRRIQNSDGSVIDEQIVTHTRPEQHTYRLPGGFKFPFNLLVREAEGDWVFADQDGGTSIVWRYRFRLTSPLAWVLAAPIIHVWFRQAMQRCLDRIQAGMK